MKAFVIAMILLVGISAVAYYSLEQLPLSSQDRFSVDTNVRL